MSAVGNQDPEEIRFLLARGADPDHQDRTLNSPLFLAINLKDARIVSILAKAGANPLIENRYSENPIFICHARGYRQMEAALRRALKARERADLHRVRVN